MSQDEVEFVLAFTEAYNAADIRTALSYCAEDVETFPDASVFPEAESTRGRDQFGAFLKETRAAWVSATYLARETIDLGDGRVLVRGDWGGEGAASGIEAYSNLSAVYTVRADQISRAEYYF